MSYQFSVESEDIVVREDSTREIVWRGRIDGYPVTEVLPLSGDRCIVVLEGRRSKEIGLKNLVCVASSGAVIWRGGTPRSHDAYVAIGRTRNEVIGHTWEGFIVRVDPETGFAETIGFAK